MNSTYIKKGNYENKKEFLIKNKEHLVNRRNNINNLNNLNSSQLSRLIEAKLMMSFQSKNKINYKINNVYNYHKEEKINSFSILSNSINQKIGNSNIDFDVYIDDNSNSLYNNKNIKDDNNIKKNEENDIKNIILNLKRKHELIIKEKLNSIKEIKEMNIKKNEFFDNIFRCGFYIKYESNKFYNYVISKYNIPVNKIKEYKVIDSQDNSYYKYLSIFLYNKIDYHEKIKTFILKYCKDNINNLNNIVKQVEIENDNFISAKGYINNMNNNNNFITDIEFMITCFIFGINIAIYQYSFDKENIEYVNSYFYENNTNNHLMILKKENLYHFNLIYPKKIVVNNSNHLIHLNKNEVNNTTINKSKENNLINNNINNDNSIISHNLNINNNHLSRDNNIKEEKKYYYKDSNPYPKYTMGKDENLYLNFYNFLKSTVGNKKRVWPDYIENTKDYKLRNSRKLSFYRKLGIVKEGKTNFEKNLIEPKKKIDKYIIENDKLYLTRNDYEYNNGKAELVYKKYLIPYKNDINNILNKCHSENCHPGIDETIESIKRHNYYWISMLLDVKKFIKDCIICCDNKVTYEPK